MFLAPDGRCYVAAGARRADLVYEPKTKGLLPLRLREFDLVRAIKRDEHKADERKAQLAAAVARRRAGKAKRGQRDHRKAVGHAA